MITKCVTFRHAADSLTNTARKFKQRRTCLLAPVFEKTWSATQKNVKSHVFWILKKNVKNVRCFTGHSITQPLITQLPEVSTQGRSHQVLSGPDIGAPRQNFWKRQISPYKNKLSSVVVPAPLPSPSLPSLLLEVGPVCLGEHCELPNGV